MIRVCPGPDQRQEVQRSPLCDIPLLPGQQLTINDDNIMTKIMMTLVMVFQWYPQFQYQKENHKAAFLIKY